MPNDYLGPLRPPYWSSSPEICSSRRTGLASHSNGELAGVWSARRGTYRILYEIDDVERVVRVLDVSHRGDVYRAG